MYKRTILKRLKFKKSINISDEAKDFISRLLVKNPKKRLGSKRGFIEVFEHPWFRDFDWVDLLERKIKAPYQPMMGAWENNFESKFIN